MRTRETATKQEMKAYNNAVGLLNSFAETDRAKFKDILTNREIPLALAMLEEKSGILRLDQKVAQLCSDCFMLGVFMASRDNKAMPSDQEQISKCLRCDFIESRSGTLRCKLDKCKY